MYGYYTPRHKVFISFYHKDDQAYKEYIDKYLSGNIINKSVKDGEYSTDSSDEYIKRLIREDKIREPLNNSLCPVPTRCINRFCAWLRQFQHKIGIIPLIFCSISRKRADCHYIRLWRLFARR